MRVVMIRALAESIPPVRLAFGEIFPEAEVINLLNEGLFIDFKDKLSPTLLRADGDVGDLQRRTWRRRHRPGLFCVRPGS